MDELNQVSPARVGARVDGAHPAAARLKEAFLRMARSLAKRPHWSFHEVATRVDRAPCYQALVRATDAVIDAGAPIEDALAFVGEFEAYIRSRYARPGARPMSCMLLEEARAGAEADVAQSEALASPSLSAFARVIDTGERHLERLRETISAARTELLVTRKPRLALARAGRGEVRHAQPTTAQRA